MTVITMGCDALMHPKGGTQTSQCEDAFAISRTSAMAAVSDGAGTAFESRRWAKLLANAFVERTPLKLDPGKFPEWVESVAMEWSESIPWQRLNVFEEAKASSGSAATLVGVNFEPSPQRDDFGIWHCLALGDSCLFQVSGGRLIRALPITSSAEFDVHPALIATRRDATERYLDQLVVEQGTWRSGDRFLLLTDAVAAWFLREVEDGGRPWETLASHDQRSFGSFIDDLRASRLIRNDDVTVLSLEVSAPAEPGTLTSEPGAREPVAHAASAPKLAHALTEGPPARRPGHVHALPGDSADDRDARPTAPAARPDGAGAHARAAGKSVYRRRRAVLLAVCLMVAIALGGAVALGRTPRTSNRRVTRPANVSMLAAARGFAADLVTFRGDDLVRYEATLRALSTSQFAASFAHSIDQRSSEFTPFESTGRVISISAASPGMARDVLYAVASQTTVDRRTGHQSSRVLLIRVQLVPSGGKWKVSGISFIASSAWLLPPPSPQPTGSRRRSHGAAP